MSVFHLKENDTEPGLEVVLVKEDGTPVDLDLYSAIWLHVKLEDGSVFTRQMTKDGTPASGIVRYPWVAADWTGSPKLVVGTHRMEYEGLKVSGGRKTFPNDASINHTLRITDDIGQAT